ncbi:MAG: hypothetical protein RJB62_355 [Pseudomonadota bacterium]|jgi:hypothetical protein
MIFRKKTRDPNEREIFGMHPGDLGIVAVAALITVVFVYMLLTPKDFDAFNRALAPVKPPAPKAQTGAPGITQMQIYDAKKK